MTGQDLLDRMELLDAEKQLQTGEADVTRGLLALNVAQDHFEARAALRPNALGSGTGTVVTAASTETTAYPANLLRIDRMQLLGTNSRPESELRALRRAGGHAATTFWPWSLVTAQTTGVPRAWWANGTNIYWSPLPSGVRTVRWYGLQAAAAITAGGTFAYPDIVALPLAAFAVRILKVGLDDEPTDILGVSAEAFDDVLKTLARFTRDGPAGFEYQYSHDT